MNEKIFSGLENTTIIDSGTISSKIEPTIQQMINNPLSIFSANVVIGIITLIRILSLIRVIKDIKTRTKSLFLQIISILLVTILTPIIGLPIYLTFRPKFTYKDKLYRREALDLQTTTCKHCGMINNFQFDFCVSCGKSIHHKCADCNQNYSYEYNNCPYCGSSKNIKRTHK